MREKHNVDDGNRIASSKLDCPLLIIPYNPSIAVQPAYLIFLLALGTLAARLFTKPE